MRGGQKSKQEWQEIVEDFKNSGKSKRNYCRNKDLKYHSFKYWYYRLNCNNGSKVVGEKKDYSLTISESEEAKIGFTRLKVVEGNEDLMTGNNVYCKMVETEEQVSVVKLTLRSGIKLELETGNIFELIRELNYVT